MFASMKTINYRRAVTFSIPANWAVEDEPGRQASFYERRPGSGTLKVNAYGFERNDPEGIDGDDLPPALEGQPWEDFPAGVRLFTESRPSPRRADLLERRWLYQVPLGKNAYRLIVFTYTIVGSMKDEPANAAEYAMLDKMIRQAHISLEPGFNELDQF
ncbi:MAG: hypothetical protein GC155_17990 [Alphaproteobacteria bacterium]|nr:hypothetical protein [Alphaproteobacteria bacterium]